jgi:hypothetical protein
MESNLLRFWIWIRAPAAGRPLDFNVIRPETISIDPVAGVSAAARALAGSRESPDSDAADDEAAPGSFLSFAEARREAAAAAADVSGAPAFARLLWEVSGALAGAFCPARRLLIRPSRDKTNAHTPMTKTSPITAPVHIARPPVEFMHSSPD